MADNYKSGQILTADELNTSLNAKCDNANANISGGQIAGLTLLQVTGTTAATSPVTGAMTVAGGVGIGGDTWIGGKANAANASISGNTASSNPTTGALVVTGGVGISGNVNAGGSVNIAGTLNANIAGISAATPSTTPANGALVVTGGVGIGGALNVAGNVSANAINVANGISITGGISVDTITAKTSITAPVGTITGTTQSVSPTTGALVVTGGLGVGGNLNAGGRFYAVESQNLLQNSTGEFGATGWNSANIPAMAGPVNGGTVFFNAVALSAAATDASVSMPITPNIPMSLSGDLFTSGVTSGTVAATLTAFNSSGVSLGNVCSITLANGQSWTTQTATGTTPPNTASVVLTKGITGASVAAPINSVGFRFLKVETGATPTQYSQEASIAGVPNLAAAAGTNAAIIYAIALG